MVTVIKDVTSTLHKIFPGPENPWHCPGAVARFIEGVSRCPNCGEIPEDINNHHECLKDFFNFEVMFCECTRLDNYRPLESYYFDADDINEDSASCASCDYNH